MGKKILIFITVFGIIIPKITILKAQETAVEKLKKKEKGGKSIYEEKRAPAPFLSRKIPVMVFRLKKIPHFKEVIPILGTITPFEKIELQFPEKGTVKKVYVEEGDIIHKGDILAELKEKEFILRRDYAKNKYQSEKALLLSMQKEYEIKKSLYEKGAILKEKLKELELRIEAQRYKVESAKKEWELTEEVLKKIKLYSPCEGKIDKREIDEGELVTPDVKAFTILRIDKVFAEVGITERDISKIKKGQPAQIKVEAYPEEVFEGKVRNILPSLKGSSRTLTLKIEIDNERYNYQLLPGMFLRGEIIIEEFKNAYLVPKNALVEIGPNIYGICILDTKIKKFSSEDIEEGKVKGTILLKKIKVLSYGAEYASIKGLEENTLIITRSEGEPTPFATGVVVNIEEYEEEEE